VEALQRLQAHGLPVVFSNAVVRDSLRVEREPVATTPREILDELLAPHGLRVIAGARGRLVVVRDPRQPAPAAPAQQRAIDPPAVTVEERLVVRPGRGEPHHGEPAGALPLDLEVTRTTPHLADDLLRATAWLPGTAATEASSRFRLRGGRDDEVQIVLDGLELLAPYHLQDFDSALSIFAPGSLGTAELLAGGYPPEFGDRLGGILDLTSVEVGGSRRHELGIGLLFADAATAGSFDRGRGDGYGSVRVGSYHLALEVNGREENPTYADLFGKLDYRPTSAHRLRLNLLSADDQFRLGGTGATEERYRNRWESRYVWLTHGAVLRSSRLVETVVSAGRVGRDRSGLKDTPGSEFAVSDRRTFDLVGLKQVWRQAGRRWGGDAGFELRQYRSRLDYASEHDLAGPLVPLRTRPAVGATASSLRFDLLQGAAFASARARPRADLTAELGLRLDRLGLPGELHLGPRLGLAWSPHPGSTLRLAVGEHAQSQRPNELQVEDGETMLAPAERARHVGVGFEHRWGRGRRFRAEIYQRCWSHTRPRFENLFDPLVPFPELTTDRVRFDPEGGRARGLELYYQGAEHGRWRHSLAYTWSRSEDRIAGRRVPRDADQPHAVRVQLGFGLGRGFELESVWLLHSGWPTTRVTGRVVEEVGGIVRIEPVLGPLHGERFPVYHRLDLRLSRSFQLSRGGLAAYLDLQNVYDRRNVRGLDGFSFPASSSPGEVPLQAEPVYWGRRLPSFGLRWRF
jgi:hypothetical protein